MFLALYTRTQPKPACPPGPAIFLQLHLHPRGPGTGRPFGYPMDAGRSRPGSLWWSASLGAREPDPRYPQAGGLALARIEHGDPVLIREGSFTGYQAIFDVRISGHDRVRVLSSLLNRQQLPLESLGSQIERKKIVLNELW